jgi:N-acetylmuramoyl-L-alanine amidase
LGQFKKDVLRIVFDLVQPVEAKLSIAEESQGESGSLVIELFRPDLKVQDVETPAPMAMGSQSDKKKVIVIDPGHGGDDPGAVGPRGTLEKDVVLGFARSLKKAFDEKKGYQVYLTRNGDYFLPLRKRVSIAEEYGADLFISVHADSNRIKKTRGSSVYCLSMKGASDEAARCLAEKENASDLIGGIPFTESDDLNFTLLDLALTNTIKSSLRFGALVLREVKKVNPVRFEKPKQAGFKVLKTAEVPSILIELGFISNPTEERLLKQKQFRAILARAILSASYTFFDYMARNESLHHYPRNAKTSRESVLFYQP